MCVALFQHCPFLLFYIPLFMFNVKILLQFLSRYIHIFFWEVWKLSTKGLTTFLTLKWLIIGLSLGR